MKTALFVGRFQPLHKGHVHAIKGAMKKYRVIVAIGSTNKADENNPFPFQARKKMLRAVFPRIKVIGMPDCKTDKEWLGRLEKKARFDMVVSGSPRAGKWFPGSVIEKPVMLDRRKYNATRIRKLIKSGKRWQHLVPRKVVILINKRKNNKN